jgi:demethylmenaquinone methyltransferase/2-methoxy-6-polyprenyl-1,4-benzoquinol methylase
MMVQGARKIVAGPITPVCGDSLALPFPNDNFDGAMVGFGVRNLSDLECGLRELYRVLKRGKLLVVLEFALPPNPFVRMAYLLYFRRVLPVVGRIISGHPWAYRYLPESVEEFPGPDELGLLFKKVKGKKLARKRTGTSSSPKNALMNSIMQPLRCPM